MFKTKKTRSEVEDSTRTFASSDVSRIAQVSLRQLQWWDERKVVSPRHEGHKRVYLTEEVIEITVIAELRRKGFSLQKIRRVIRFIQKELGKRLVATVTDASEYHLLTDGRRIYLEDSARAVVDLLKNARQPMLFVCLTDTIQRVLHPLERNKVARRGDRPGAEMRTTSLVPSAAEGKHKGSVRHLSVRGRMAS